MYSGEDMLLKFMAVSMYAEDILKRRRRPHGPRHYIECSARPVQRAKTARRVELDAKTTNRK